jgi:hypothetical protein
MLPPPLLLVDGLPCRDVNFSTSFEILDGP